MFNRKFFISIMLVALAVLFSFETRAAEESSSFGIKRTAFQSCSFLKKGVALAIKTNTICVVGNINSVLKQDLQNILRATPLSKFKIVNVVVISHGGEAIAAMDIAEIIEKTQYDIVIGSSCFSACAQFIFMANKNNKFILSTGLVAFHGGPLTNDKINEMSINKAGKKHLKYESDRFVKFYADRNLDLKMLTNPPPSVAKKLAEGRSVFWSWPRKKLLEFGVSNIFFENDD